MITQIIYMYNVVKLLLQARGSDSATCNGQTVYSLIRGNFLFLSYDKFLVEQNEDHSLLKFINLSILSTLSKHILWKAKENYIQDLKGVVSTTPLFFFTYGDDKLQ